MSGDRLPLTSEAYRNVERDLARWRREKAEKSEDEAIVDARIARLEGILARAEVVESTTDATRISIGSRVEVRDCATGKTEQYVIDGAHGSLDPDVVSALSPMGSALIGAVAGAIVEVALPRGKTRRFEVMAVDAA